MHLDHVTLRTTDLARTRDFFLSVFDLKEGTRPAAIQRIPGHWLYAGDEPVLHLIGSQGNGIERAAEAWDHAAFRLKDYAGFKARLEAMAIPYSPMDLPDIHERRLFFRAPGGPLIETVFKGADNDLY